MALTDAGSLAIAGAVTGPAGVTLTSSGGSITGGGIITTGTLTGSAATDVTLTGANQVNNLGNFAATAGSFTLIDVPALTVLAGDTVKRRHHGDADRHRFARHRRRGHRPGRCHADQQRRQHHRRPSSPPAR